MAPDATRRAELSPSAWLALVAQRERIIAMGLARGLGPDDAEDCAQETILRVAARYPAIPAEDLPKLVAVIGKTVAADVHRARLQRARVAARLTALDRRAGDDVADTVVLRRVAHLLTGHIRQLPERERDVLAYRASGYSAGDTASALGVSYKAVDSAYTRARNRLRLIKLVGLGWLVGFLRRLRNQATPVATAAVTSVAITLVGLYYLVPWSPPRSSTQGQSPSPSPTAPSAVLELFSPPPVAPPVYAPPPAGAPTSPGAPHPAAGPVTLASTGPVHVGGAHAGGVAVLEYTNPRPFAGAVLHCLVGGGLQLGPDTYGCPP
jgi:DNA-directed RNA polymerase specialized sigma24 family protein